MFTTSEFNTKYSWADDFRKPKDIRIAKNISNIYTLQFNKKNQRKRKKLTEKVKYLYKFSFYPNWTETN